MPWVWKDSILNAILEMDAFHTRHVDIWIPDFEDAAICQSVHVKHALVDVQTPQGTRIDCQNTEGPFLKICSPKAYSLTCRKVQGLAASILENQTI